MICVVYVCNLVRIAAKSHLWYLANFSELIRFPLKSSEKLICSNLVKVAHTHGMKALFCAFISSSLID